MIKAFGGGLYLEKVFKEVMKLKRGNCMSFLGLPERSVTDGQLKTTEVYAGRESAVKAMAGLGPSEGSQGASVLVSLKLWWRPATPGAPWLVDT